MFRRAVAIWLVIVAVEMIHGILRTIFLVPVVGDFRSRQIGALSGSLLILVVAYLFIPWLQAGDTRSLLKVGFSWLALMLTFEFSFGHFVFGRSWADLASDYDIGHGGLLLIMTVVLVFSPVIATRLHRLKGVR